METIMKKTIEPTKVNIEKTIDDIRSYAEKKGYQFLNLIETQEPNFDSVSQKKKCGKWMELLERKMSMGKANRFLHFLHKKVYKMKDSSRVEFSEKELKIIAAKKAWNSTKKLAESALKAYKEEKSDFYKR